MKLTNHELWIRTGYEDSKTITVAWATDVTSPGVIYIPLYELDRMVYSIDPKPKVYRLPHVLPLFILYMGWDLLAFFKKLC